MTERECRPPESVAAIRQDHLEVAWGAFMLPVESGGLDDRSVEMMRLLRAITAYHSLVAAASPAAVAHSMAAGTEYVVVPMEPTQDMADRGGWCITSEVAWGVIQGKEHTTDVAAAAVYRAMIRAALATRAADQ